MFEYNGGVFFQKAFLPRRKILQKSTLYSIILFFSSLFTLVGSGVAVYFLLVPEHRDVITVQMEQLVEEETDRTVSFTALSLYPGAECTYTLELVGDTDAVYDLLVSFTDEDSALTEYLHARLALLPLKATPILRKPSMQEKPLSFWQQAHTISPLLHRTKPLPL